MCSTPLQDNVDETPQSYSSANTAYHGVIHHFKSHFCKIEDAKNRGYFPPPLFHTNTYSLVHFPTKQYYPCTSSDYSQLDFDTTNQSPPSNQLLALLVDDVIRAPSGKRRARSSKLKTEQRFLTVTVNKNSTCHVCKKTFSSYSSLSDHANVHTGERPFKCSMCTLCFAHRSTLLKHHRTHSGRKPFVCNICQKRFSQSGNLMRHRRAVHSASSCQQ